MAVEQFVLNAYATIVSWTEVLLCILLIAKIIQFFFGGTGGIFRRKGGDDTTNTKPAKKTPSAVSTEDKIKRAEKDKNGVPEGLDTNKPGLVQVMVYDEDDNPLQGTKVRITPARMHKRRWFKTKKDWRQYGGLTNADGAWPGRGQYEKIGSGSVEVEVSKNDFYVTNWLSDKALYQSKDYEIVPGEKHEIIVRMGRKGEKAELFEPEIVEVAIEPDKTKLRGRIN